MVEIRDREEGTKKIEAIKTNDHPIAIRHCSQLNEAEMSVIDVP